MSGAPIPGGAPRLDVSDSAVGRLKILRLADSKPMVYTIEDGIVYDAKKLLADVAAMVEAQKKQRSTAQ